MFPCRTLKRDVRRVVYSFLCILHTSPPKRKIGNLNLVSRALKLALFGISAFEPHSEPNCHLVKEASFHMVSVQDHVGFVGDFTLWLEGARGREEKRHRKSVNQEGRGGYSCWNFALP